MAAKCNAYELNLCILHHFSRPAPCAGLAMLVLDQTMIGAQLHSPWPMGGLQGSVGHQGLSV